MSLVISLYVREGIVMASDSRLTINSEEPGPEGKNIYTLAATMTDTNNKTFLAFNRIGISTFGQAAIQGIPVAGFIDSFIHQIDQTPNLSVEQFSRKLLEYFRKFDPIPDIGFHVGGYENSNQGPIPQIFRVVPLLNSYELANPPQDGQYIQGASWDGEGDILARLIQPVTHQQGPGQSHELPHFQIPWQIFTLQDAIDFAVYAIRTTIDSIRFQPRPKTVGGPIDVLVIKPDGTQWIAKKELSISNN
ncbi:MAG: hypothetical protein ACEPOZ_10175 [Marinifilaceae bacterium]|jgi:hypothetical protein